MVRLLTAICCCAFASSALAKSWYVVPDGTGDAPTIPAALDSAIAGDDVLVGPGTYTWSTQGGTLTEHGWSMIVLKSGVVLHSEMGPGATILDAEGQGRVVYCTRVSTATRLEGFTITGGAALGMPMPSGGGILCMTFGSPLIRGNIVRDNRATWNGGGITANHALPIIEDNFILWNRPYGLNYYPAIGPMTITGNTIHGNSGGGILCISGLGQIERNLIAANPDGPGIFCGFPDEPTTTQNVIWGNIEGPSTCSGFDPGANVLADPLACIVGISSVSPLRVQPESPCLPANNPWQVRIGAPMDLCTSTDAPPPPETTRAAWAAVKHLYR